MASSAKNTSGPIKIGANFMLTGAMAELGRDSFDGADVALRLVNDQGGVAGRRLEWVKVDGFSPAEAAQQAERMITQEGVRIVIGCCGSNHTIDVSKVCEKHNSILWVQNAWTAALFDHVPRYTFRTNTFTVPVQDTAVDYVLSHALPRVGKTKIDVRVAVINEGSAYGVSCEEETVKALRHRDVEPIFIDSYDAHHEGSTSDFAAKMKAVQKADPDVLFASSLIHDAIGILRAMKQVGFRPPIMMTSSAGFGLYTLNLAGEMTEGVLSANAPAVVSPSALKDAGRDLQREYISRLKGMTGREPSGFNAMAFCAAYSLFHDVLPKVESIEDTDAIRDVAMSLDIPLGTYPNGWGLKFDASGQNTRCPVSIDQWQDGALRTVWPLDLATDRVRNIPLPQIN